MMSCSLCLYLITSSALATTVFGDVRISWPEDDEMSVEHHTELRLVCDVPAGSSAVVWYRGLDWVEQDDDVTIIDVEDDDGSGRRQVALVVAEAEPEHAGEYSCEADGQRSINKVNVIITDNIHDVTVAESEVVLGLGYDLLLTCQADIHAHVAWYHADTHLTSADDRITVTETEDTQGHLMTLTLVRRNVNVKDAGVYTCKEVHHDDQQAQVNVVIDENIRQARDDDGGNANNSADRVSRYLYQLMGVWALVIGWSRLGSAAFR